MDALKNYTYDSIVMRQSELYVCTTKKIADYVVKTMKYYGADNKNAIKDLTFSTIPKPGDSQTLVWMMQLNQMYKYGKRK